MLPAMPTPISTPPPTSPEEGRILARQRVRARKQRARTIRRRVIAITLSLFLVAWVAIFGRLVTGHDPALGATTPHPATTTTTASGAAQAAAKRAATARAQARAAARAKANAAAAASSAPTDTGSSASST